MVSPVKEKEVYSKISSSTQDTISKKPLVSRILTLNTYIKTLSSQQKTNPEIVNEVNGIVNDLAAIIGLPVKSDGTPIVFSMDYPDEFFEALAQMAENILPDEGISQGGIPTNLSELVEQMETQIEAEKAAKALVSKTGISISEARKTVNQFIQEQVSSIETAINESTEISSGEKNDFTPIVRKAVPVLIRQQFEETGKTTPPSTILDQVEKISKKSKNTTPPVLIALREKQGALTNVFGKFGSISTKAKVEVVRAESTIIVDKLLNNQPEEVKTKVVNQATASLINKVRVKPPTTSQETVAVFSKTVVSSVRKAAPSVVASKKDVVSTVNEISQLSKPAAENVLFETLNEVADQPPEIVEKVAIEQLEKSYLEITGDKKTAISLASTDIVLMNIFGDSNPAEPTILVSKDSLSPTIVKHLQKIPTQAWVSFAEIEESVPEDLFKAWFESVSKSEKGREIIAIQASPDQEIIPLANYNPEKFIPLSVLEDNSGTGELFSTQDFPQAGDVSNRVNFIRNLFRVWQEQRQIEFTIPTAVQTPGVTAQPAPSWFSRSPIGQRLRRIGGFLKGKLSPVFSKLRGGILKKLGSTAVGQAVKGLLTKLGATALGALAGIASGGLALIPAALGLLKSIAGKLGIKLPSIANFAKRILGVGGKGTAGALEATAKILAGVTLGSVAIPLGAIIIGLFSVLAFISLLVPIISGGAIVQSELGGPGRGTESGIQGDVVDPEGNHLADRTEIAMKNCLGMDTITKDKCLTAGQKQIWITCLIGQGISPEDSQRVVNVSCESATNFDTLQCVGYKKAVEENFPGGHNACWFANDAGARIPQEIGSIQVGDNAVWGSDCCDQCNLGNLSCCGHIGIITKIEPGSDGRENWIYVTSAQGGTGNVNTIKISLGDPTAILRY